MQAVVERYRARHNGWNVMRFCAWYRADAGLRSCTWVKTTLQEAGLVAKEKGEGGPSKEARAKSLVGDEAAPGRIDP